jgi:tetratricopeptide (TPR) repeat protein/DNA-binding winged helix-turn-helix (wHTH) protein/TolB-like protein
MDTNSSRNQAESPVRIGEFELYPDRLLVRRGGEDIPIRQQTLRVLLCLIEHRERIVSRDELHAAVWGDTAVTPDALVQCIVEIRKILGDSAREPRFIRTVQRSGYAFIGPAGTEAPPAAVAAPVPIVVPLVPPTSRWRRYAAVALAAVILIAIVAPGRIGPAAPRWPNDSGRKRLMLLPFENASNDVSVGWLVDGLPNMLMTGLGRSPAISAVTMTDADEGRAIARKARADGVVSGSFTTIGDTLRVDVRIESADGATIATDSLVAARHVAVLTEIDVLARRLMTAVGVGAPADGITAQFGDVMTRNLEAYRNYILGVERANAIEPAAAIEFFEQAVKHDPAFAMAHARIGAAYAVTLGFADKGQPHLAKAFALSDRLRERDRLWILAWYSLAKVDYDNAVTPLETLIAKYPDDVEAYSLLGNIFTGQERWDAATDVINRGLRIRPNAKDLLNHASAVATLSGQADAAIDFARRYIAVAPAEANAYDSLGLRLQHFGRYDEALDAFAEAARVNPKFRIGYAHAGNVYFQQGRYREAAASYTQFLRTATNDEERARAHTSLAWIAYRGGDTRRARALADQALSLSKRSWWPAGYFAWVRGDQAGYQRVMRDLQQAGHFSNRGKPYPPITERYLSGLDLLSAGRTDQAIAELREAVRHPPIDWAINPLEDCLAETFLTLGRDDEAAAEYRRLAGARPWVAWYHYRLAEIAERGGDGPLAIREFQQFLQLWPRADANVPAVAAARRRVTAVASPVSTTHLTRRYQ